MAEEGPHKRGETEGEHSGICLKILKFYEGNFVLMNGSLSMQMSCTCC